MILDTILKELPNVYGREHNYEISDVGYLENGAEFIKIRVSFGEILVYVDTDTSKMSSKSIAIFKLATEVDNKALSQFDKTTLVCDKENWTFAFFYFVNILKKLKLDV